MTDLPAWLAQPSRARRRILFARHGEYEGNVRNLCNCDPTVPYPLTPRGQAQAAALAERLRGEGVGLIVSSQFQRARQTAAVIAQVVQAPVAVHRLANENHVGTDFDGKPPELFLQSIQADPAGTANPGGESFLAMKARMQRLIEDLTLSSPETILVVTHGWPMQAVRVLLGQLSDRDAALCQDMPGNCQLLDAVFPVLS